MLYYYDQLMLAHETGRHPECPARLAAIAERLAATGLAEQMTPRHWQPAALEPLAAVHGRAYLEELASLAEAGGGWLDEDTVCSPRSFDAARLAAGAVCDAVDQVLSGPQRQAFCAVRPPGHHALQNAAMGFCLLGNVAVAAQMALDVWGLNRVLIVDWDVHHGNGTQAMFWENEQVGFLSIHRWPFYPGTGRADETGTGGALGTKLNLPIEFGLSRAAYLAEFRSGLERLAERMRPELVLLSAGFDAHRDDPVGSLELETEDFVPLTQAVIDVAQAYAGGRLVSVLEGGYDLPALADSVEAHLRTLIAGEVR